MLFEQEVCRRVRVKMRKRKNLPPSRISDNSEPWNRDPRTVADLWHIAVQVQEVVDRWATRS